VADQVDIAVDLGAVPAPLPRMVSLREFASAPHPAPPQIIQGVLPRAENDLSGTSKSKQVVVSARSALSVATASRGGVAACQRSPVAYINFELHPWAMEQRIGALCVASARMPGMGETPFPVESARSQRRLALLRPKLENRTDAATVRTDYSRSRLQVARQPDGTPRRTRQPDERFEALAQRTGRSIVIAPPFAGRQFIEERD